MWWQNIDESREELPPMTPYNIQNNEAVVCAESVGDIILRKAHINLTEAYDKHKMETDKIDEILCEKDGTKFGKDGRKIAINKPLYNNNIIAYMIADSFLIDRKHIGLLRAAEYRGHGFYVRSDNFVEKLPIFVASYFPYDK
ncbi:MAG: hypothetical protein LBD46_03280 [Endomicrobium sp.]|jgi:hypothetical protein|nr:hypothetical protein [Endomicrobium sp.]